MANIFIHPERKKLPMKPFKAMSHMKKLIENKEDTEQVFEIIEALNGNNIVDILEGFKATEEGRARIEEQRYLPPFLDDRREDLLKLPEGSVGRTYVDFMIREGLTAQGLVDESELRDRVEYGDTLEWLGKRLRDTHDMHHILSGYGRDALGEASLLAFTHGQMGGRGIIFIAYMGMRQIRKEAPKHIDVMSCFHEGRKNGKAAAKIAHQDILGMLEQPLEEVRERLGIKPPVQYQKAFAQILELEASESQFLAVA